MGASLAVTVVLKLRWSGVCAPIHYIMIAQSLLHGVCLACIECEVLQSVLNTRVCIASRRERLDH
jgi:hypothetical protein